ncbi:hypothetical protein [Micromonospora sp. NPDC023737]|uniref:hypothetical protein n=1 Tax=unclassified Micromonospora TaxID=2617518 RepID=UPI0033E56824
MWDMHAYVAEDPYARWSMIANWVSAGATTAGVILAAIGGAVAYRLFRLESDRDARTEIAARRQQASAVGFWMNLEGAHGVEAYVVNTSALPIYKVQVVARFEVDPVDRLELEEELGHHALTPEYRELTTAPEGNPDGKFRISSIEKEVLAPSEQVLFYVGDRYPPRYIYALFGDNYGQIWVRDASGTIVERTDQHSKKIRTGEPLFD